MPTLDSLNAMADWQWMPTEGRSARDINMENALYERERRRREPQQFRTVLPFTEWDPFFGGLARTKDAAEAAGMRFAVDWRGFGRPEGETSMPTSRTGVLPGANYATEADLADARQQQLRDYGVRQLAAATGAAEDKARAVNQAVEDPMDLDRAAANARLTPGFDMLAPDQQRARIMAMTPYHLRAGLEQQFAAQDLKERQQAEVERHNKATEDLTGGAMLSDDAITQTAKRYLETGVMPPLGMGDKTTRQRVLNKAAELGGADANVAANSAVFGADKASLTKMQAQRDAIGAFEETAKKNMDVFLKAAEKVVDTGSPLLNQPARTISGKMLGSPDQAAFEAARNVLLPEIARIITNPNLSGVLSDSAREEVASFNPASATLGQTVRVMKLLKQDMENRTQSLDDQLARIKGRVGQSQKTDGAANPERREIPGHPGTFAEFRDGKWVRVQ